MSNKVRWIKHYNSSQKILLVGEGDFSFSARLAKRFRSASNMVATCFDFEGAAHLEYLESKGCLVLYGIDVYEMNRDPNLVPIKFDVIIFNFPHAGHFPGLCEKVSELIEDDYPYGEWKVVELAKNSGLDLKEKVEFRKYYPGYHNKSGGDIKSNKTFRIIAGFTFKFSLRESTTQMTCNDNQLSDTVNDGVSGLIVALDDVHLE